MVLHVRSTPSAWFHDFSETNRIGSIRYINVYDTLQLVTTNRFRIVLLRRRKNPPISEIISKFANEKMESLDLEQFAGSNASGYCKFKEKYKFVHVQEVCQRLKEKRMHNEIS